jgi:solute carrier family 19 (thiamine transporter), member 2/3
LYYLRYKPLIVVSGIAGIIVWSMLLWTTSLRSLQVIQVFYGTYMATEIAYYTYIYAKVDKEYYQKVTSHTRAATLSGKFIAATLSQILVYFKWMDYRELNYLTLATQIMATVWAFSLPPVHNSLYFHRQPDNQNLVVRASDSGFEEHKRSSSSVMIPLSEKGNDIKKNDENKKNKEVNPFQLLWMHFKSAYTNKQVLKWSIWYTLATCGYYQIVSYIQVLWSAIASNEEVSDFFFLNQC